MATIGKLESGLIASDIGLPPWFYSRAVALSRAVGRVSVGGRGFGTGFLVAPRLMLTCHSVLPDVATASGSSFELDYHSNQDGTFEPVTAVRLRPDLCFVADAPRDFALVALESPLTDRPVIALAAEGGKRMTGERVSLFHHPHAGPLLLALRAGAIVAMEGGVLHHDSDTAPGSAGAPVLDDSLRLIGLHHAARVIASGQVNEAIRTTAILSVLAANPTLRAELGGKRPTSVSSTPVIPAVTTPPSHATATLELAATSARPTRSSVFISYARGDQGKRQWRDRLRTFLAPFQTEIDVWDDSRIETGAQWRAEIDFALKRARVAVLLVGPAFLASDFIASNELPPLLQAARTEGVVILPLITNHSSYEKTALGGYQAFNDIKHPLEDMGRSEQNKWLRLFAEKISDAFHKAGT